MEFCNALVAKKIEGCKVTLETSLRRSDAWEGAMVRANADLARLTNDPPQTVDALRMLEANSAAAYFRAWRATSLVWRAFSRHPIPDDWRTIGKRSSRFRGTGSQSAAHPVNAILNYAYAVLQNQVQIKAVADGYDPMLGIMHHDRDGAPALADQLIDAIIEKGDGDFSRDLSTPMASIYTMKFLGLPLEDWSDYAWFVQSARSGSSSVEPRTKTRSELELYERVAAEVVRQRTRPAAGGVIAHLLEATIDGRKLENWEIEAYIWLLLGNVATTPAWTASSFVWLSRNPEQRRRIFERLDLLPNAIEELLRVFTPFHAVSRTVLRDVELAGQSLKGGERVLLCWVSGNLDETEFPNPDKVDVDRANKRHMSFGLSRHYCIGADAVRLEFRTMLEQILRRIPDFRVDEAGLRPTLTPAVVAGYVRVPFVFAPGKKVGGPHIAY